MYQINEYEFESKDKNDFKNKFQTVDNCPL